MIEILSATYDGNLPAFFVRLLAGLGIVLTATFIAAFCASMYVDRFDDIRLSPRSVLIAIGIGTAVALPIVVNKLVRSA